MNHPIALVILDGFGVSKNKEYNAVVHAKTPHTKHLINVYPNTLIQASGVAVGLPAGMQGNSEVGHITIGAGRIIEQPTLVWLNAIQNKSFFTNAILLNNLHILKNNGHALHIMGLLSDAGIHSHEDFIYACIDAAVHVGIKKIIIHPFLDGRDSPPQSAAHYLQKLSDYIQHIPQAIIGSVHGRFYSMDRDNNWQRTEKSYRILTEPQNHEPTTWETVLNNKYAQGITDEFIMPTQLSSDSIVGDSDGIIFCNTRPDRARQLTACFVQHSFDHFETQQNKLSFFITPINYGPYLPTTGLFERPIIKNTLKDILAQHNKTIFSIAETEKYAHITYFFRGEQEDTVATETRVLIPSIKTESYRDHPHMSAQQITDAVITSLKTKPCDFYLINYANADMVGHSGDFDATVKAIEFLDTQLAKLYDTVVTQMNGTLIITADHGKAEDMFDQKTHQPRTAHTTNPVPFIFINKKYKNVSIHLPVHELADIAPFILQYMGLPVPEEMRHK